MYNGCLYSTNQLIVHSSSSVPRAAVDLTIKFNMTGSYNREQCDRFFYRIVRRRAVLGGE